MDGLQIFLFGRFEVKSQGEYLTTLDARKAQELLCYVLLYPNRAHLRETLTDLLWTEAGKSHKAYLRKAIWQLQSALDKQVSVTEKPLLTVEGDWVQLNDAATYWSDIQVFTDAFSTVENLPGDTLDQKQAQLLQQVVDLYRGDLMEGCYEDWCLIERVRYKHMYLAMQDKLMHYYEAQTHFDRGIACGIEVLRHDPAREHTYRRLMRLYSQAGNRSEALRQYNKCAEILKTELAVEPELQTQALYEAIRSGQSMTLSLNLNLTSIENNITLQDTLRELKRSAESLDQLCHKLKQDIRTIQHLIDAG